MSRETYVTLATCDTYCVGALVLGASLRQVQTAKQLTIMVTANVNEKWRQILRNTYDNIVEVTDIRNRFPLAFYPAEKNACFTDFTKIHCWNLVQFSKAVYLDADTMVLYNVDELFEREELSAAPDPSWPDCFNSGVFVFQPSVDTFQSLEKMASETGSFDGRDQGLLNTYFSDWMNRGSMRRLPYIYNCICRITDEPVLEFYTSPPAWVHFGGSIRVAHFAGPIKPWHRPSAAKNCTATACTALLAASPNRRSISRTSGMLAYWWSLFLVFVRPHLTSDMMLLSAQSPSGGDFIYPYKQNGSAVCVPSSDQTSYAPYRPSFSQYYAQDPARSLPLDPQALIPYHPEFHETRWDYLHPRQRIDLDNRFLEEHYVQKTVHVPLQALCSSQRVPPGISVHARPPQQAAQILEVPHSSDTPSIPTSGQTTIPWTVLTPSKPSTVSAPPCFERHGLQTEDVVPQQIVKLDLRGRSLSGSDDMIQGQISAANSLTTPPLYTNFSLDCHKCRKELAEATGKQDASAKFTHREPDKLLSLRPSARVIRRSRKGVSHPSGELETFRGRSTISSGRPDGRHKSTLGSVTKGYELTVNKNMSLTLDGPSGSSSVTAFGEHKLDGNLRKDANTVSARQWSSGWTVGVGGRPAPKSAHAPESGIQEVLDLALLTTTKQGDTLHFRDKAIRMKARARKAFPLLVSKQQSPSWDHISLGLRKSRSTPGDLRRVGALIDVEALRHPPDIQRQYDIHNRPISDSYFGPNSLLRRSRRRTIAQLRKVRDKRREHRFDVCMAASSWENIGRVNELRELFASARPNTIAAVGNLGQQKLQSKLCIRHERSELERMYAWERGEIDYTGVDRFANILEKLCDTMTKAGGGSNLPIGLDIGR
ncbi:unnamed protein product [Dicrocoelium dendriticum]|nr:unnamed protein product [Dicrocoelium dendriticum]